MASKIILVCVSAIIVQGAFSQFAPGAPWGLAGPGLAGPGLIGAGLVGPGLVGPGLAGPGLGGCGCAGVASSGGGFPVTSASPIAPTGVCVVSENVYEGSLCAGGNLPLLGTVALEGVLPTAGAGAVSYGCGDGAVGIAVEEGPVVTGIAPSAPGLGFNGLAYNGLGYNGLGGVGCGCGGFY